MSASTEALEREVKDLRQDVAELRKALREEAARRKASPRAKLEEAAAENVERLRTAASDAGSKAQESLERLEQQIEANPVQAVLGAFALGFVLGRLLGR
jgi:ElaB/YqjD/DUF883 family membrane-anchored ribosome-binding protein